MKLQTKLKLGAAALLGGAAAGIAVNKTLDSLVKTHLSREGIIHPKNNVMSKQNQEDFSSSSEYILGMLFHASTPQINISIPNRDGRHINALLYKNDNDRSEYAVILHGYRSGIKAVSYLSKHYYERGYNVLVPYMRAHNGSDYEYCTMGWHERFDILDWINHICALDNDARIVLHGVSMGAATVMMTTGEDLPQNVVCAIEDCGYTSVYDAYSFKIPKMMHLPSFPSIDIFRGRIKQRVGFDIKEASALEQVKHSKTPILFLHGESDTVVPVSMAYELYAKADCDKEIMTFKDADHAMSPLLYPEQYWGKVWGFIEKYN